MRHFVSVLSVLLATAAAHAAEPSAPTAIAFDGLNRTLVPGEPAKLGVQAVLPDGSQRDVTAEARVVSTNEKILVIRPGGTLEAIGFGEACIAAHYAGKSCVARIAVPQSLPFDFPAMPANNRIDELVASKLEQLGIPPAELCSDEVFLRRVYLDVIGTLPTSDEARAFLADEAADKRARLVDRLLSSGEFADYWALKWGDLLRIKSEYPSTLWPNAVQAYHQWVRESIADNKPYDEFVRELLVSSGSNFRNPPANYYRAFQKKQPQDFGDVTALLFMGARIGCARCHPHPVEEWTSEDELGLAAFFAPVSFKSTTEWKEEIVYARPGRKLRHPETKELVAPRFLNGEVLEASGQLDPRVDFVNWLIAPENPWFARNAVNRIWYWLLGRGIVHEADDMRPTNPPANPELLDFLAGELVRHNFDLRHIYRLILTSRTYQRSSRATQWNDHDVAQFSHYLVKRLGAETLLDAICTLTERWDTYRSRIPEPFVQLPEGFRATHLADGSIGLPFLEMFGRPPRDTAFESDRDSELSLRQVLHLLNSQDVQLKISSSPRLRQLIAEQPDDQKVIEELYLAALSRHPTEEELSKVLAYFADQPTARRQSAEDLLWALMNTKEFVFNH